MTVNEIDTLPPYAISHIEAILMIRTFLNNSFSKHQTFRTYTHRNITNMRQRLRLAILECDTPLPNTAERYGGGYGGVFKALLNSASKAEGHGDVDDILDISMYQIEKEGATYPDLDKVDALLLTGSSMYYHVSSYLLEKLRRFASSGC